MILFLDFDGVMHSSDQLDDDPSRVFTHVPLLAAWLQARPEVDVVISSSWRMGHSQQAMVALLGPVIGSRVVGCTPWEPPARDDNIYPSAKLHVFTHERQVQIEAWMAASWDPQRAWVAVDDVPYLFNADCARLVVCAGRQGLSSENVHELERQATQAGLTRARESPDGGAKGMDEVFRALAVADADGSVDGMLSPVPDLEFLSVSREESVSPEPERRDSNRNQGGFSMNLWTTTVEYSATGEGETIMAWIGHAEDAAEAKAELIKVFNEFHGAFGVSIEGVARNSVTELLFSEEALRQIEYLGRKATVRAHAMLHFNRS